MMLCSVVYPIPKATLGDTATPIGFTLIDSRGAEYTFDDLIDPVVLLVPLEDAGRTPSAAYETLGALADAGDGTVTFTPESDDFDTAGFYLLQVIDEVAPNVEKFFQAVLIQVTPSV